MVFDALRYRIARRVCRTANDKFDGLRFKSGKNQYDDSDKNEFTVLMRRRTVFLTRVLFYNPC